jgi:hypothetical protein
MFLFSANGIDSIQKQNIMTLDSKDMVEFCKNKLSNAKDEEKRLRKKIKRLHFKSYQLSLLINKALSDRYPQEAQSKPPSRLGTKVIPPLMPESSESEKFLQRTLLQSDPDKLLEHFNENNIVEDLFFFSKSVFDDGLQNALTHASPDIQILFLDKVFERFKKINAFIDSLMPFIENFTSHEDLSRYLMELDSDRDNFMDFYEKTLDEIAKVVGFSSFKVVYSYEKEETLFFPTRTISQIIDISDSLSGYLINIEYDKKADYSELFTIVEEPYSDPRYETVTESCIFDGRPVLSLKVELGSHGNALALFIKEKGQRFLKKDMVKIQAALTFFTPVIALFKTAFTCVLPKSFSELADCITRLREGDGDLFDKIKREACIVTTASFCRVLVVEGAEADFPNLEILPSDASLIRAAYESNTFESIKAPRSIQAFNRAVDDSNLLTKISAMLIVPVRTLPIILVLYNPNYANEFTSAQCSMMKSFADSLPPLLQQNKVMKQLDVFMKSKQAEIDRITKVTRALKELLKKVNSVDFIDTAAEYLGCSIRVFFFLDEYDVVEFPTAKMIGITENMQSTVPSLFTEGLFDVEKEAGGDNEIKCIVIYPFISEVLQKSFIILGSKEEGFFDDINFDSDVETSDDSLFLQIVRTVLLILPAHIMSTELFSINKTVLEMLEIMKPSDEKISSFLNSKVHTIKGNEHFRAHTVSSAMDSEGGQTIVTSEKKLNPKENELLDAYAEWASVSSTNQLDEEGRNDVVVGALIRNGIHNTFQCDVFLITDFLNWCSCINKDSSIIQRIYNTCNSLLSIQTWRSWYTKEEKNLIFMISIMYGILDRLLYIPDEKTARAVDGLSPSAVKYGAVLFGTGGVGENMEENKQLLLKEALNDYAIIPNAKDETSLIAHVRVSSLDGFKPTPFNKQWIGKAIVFISQSSFIVNDPEFVAREFGSIASEEKKKSILFKTERLLLPLLTYISAKNSIIIKMISSVKDSIKSVRGK